MKNETWIALIITAIVMVLLAGVALSMGGAPRKSLDANDIPTPSPVAQTPTASSEKTEFTNERYFYALSVPTGYSLSSDLFGASPENASSLVIQAGEAQYEKPALRIQVEPVSLENTYRSKPYISTEQLAQYLQSDAQESQGVQAKIIEPIKESIYLGNQTFTFSYTGKGYEGVRASSNSYQGTYTVMVMRYRDTYYQIILNDVGDLKSILASLQFIPDTSLTRYTNSEFDFSFALESGEHAVACPRKDAQNDALLVWASKKVPSADECATLPAAKVTVSRKSPDVRTIEDWIGVAQLNEPSRSLDRSPITVSGLTGTLVKGTTPMPYSKALFERTGILYVVDGPMLTRDFKLAK